MQHRQLGKTGLSVSVLSYGASPLGSVFRTTDDSEGIKAVHAAVDHGMNFLDVSPYYGVTKAETVLGRALKEIDRDRYLLATKVGQYADGVFDFSAARVTASVDESLKRLNVEHVDLIQCHDIEHVDIRQIIDETLPALHRLKTTGKVRHVGITGLPLKVLGDVIRQVESGMVETILSFCRYELNDDALLSLLPLCESKGIGVINASPTGMGVLTERGAPAWHPASETIKQGCARAVDLCKSRGWNIVELAIQYAVANPRIATTLVGSADPKNILANIRYAETPIDPEKMQAVLDELRPIHNFNFTRGLPANVDAIIGS